jgi:hypoxia up-regulated 1
VPLKVSVVWGSPPLEGEARAAAAAQIAAWTAAEAAKRAAAAAKNELEAYVIRLKEALETDEQLQKVCPCG